MSLSRSNDLVGMQVHRAVFIRVQSAPPPEMLGKNTLSNVGLPSMPVDRAEVTSFCSQIS